MNKKQIRGFTLVEMLIVLGIIAVLSVTLILAVNPAEAQRKSRDTKRLKDLSTLETLINQAINDGQPIAGCLTSTEGCKSATTTTAQTCASNWLQLTLCAYAQSIPEDPLNGDNVGYLTGGTLNAPLRTVLSGGYRARVSGTDYAVGVRLESGANLHYITEDGYSADQNWYTVGSMITGLTFTAGN